MTNHSTPITGSSVLADQLARENPALALVLSRMEAMEQQNRLQMQELTMMLTGELDKQRKGFIGTLLAERERSRQALQAVQEKLQQQMEKKPSDPKVEKAMLQHAIKEAEQQAKHKRQRFVAALRKGEYPLGEIMHFQPHPLPLTINGVTITLQPGMNEKIPQPFIEAYQAHLQDNETARQRAAQIQGHQSFGELEHWRSQGASWGKDTKQVDDQGRIF